MISGATVYFFIINNKSTFHFHSGILSFVLRILKCIYSVLKNKARRGCVFMIIHTKLYCVFKQWL